MTLADHTTKGSSVAAADSVMVLEVASVVVVAVEDTAVAEEAETGADGLAAAAAEAGMIEEVVAADIAVVEVGVGNLVDILNLKENIMKALGCICGTEGR